MLSRRSLVGGISALPFTVSLTACAARATGVAAAPNGAGSATSAQVGPHPNWNGKSNSGAGAPNADGNRTVAKVIAAFTMPSFQRVNSGLFSVRVKADASGGINNVRFFGDCASTTVTNPKLVSVMTVHGTTRHEYVYEILLDIDSFISRNASDNTVNIYAECTATDSANITTRTIGPLVVYPERASRNDTANGVHIGYFSLDGRPGPDGNPSSIGIVDALAAARTAILGGKTAAVLTCIQTGQYVPGSGHADSYATPARGYCVVTTQPGITCTIGRNSIPDLNNSASWAWASSINGVEWRGSGIVFDNAYFSVTLSQNSSDRPDWFNGCKWIDSLGRDRLWNGQPHPGRGPEGTTTTIFRSYYTDCYFENGSSPFLASPGLLDIGNRSNWTFGDLHSGGAFVHSAHDTNSSSAWFRTALDEIRLTYSGPGTASIAKSGYGGPNANSSGDITVVVNNVPYTLKPKRFPNEANISDLSFWSFEDLSACLNSIPGIKSTTLSSNSGRQARYNYAPQAIGATTNGWQPTEVSSRAPFTIKSFIDIHGDWYQSGLPGNVIIANCIVSGTNNDFSGMLFMGNEIDSLVENNIFNAQFSSPCGWNGAHLIYRNNNFGMGPGMLGQVNSSSYSQFSNNAVNSMGSLMNNSPQRRNNYTADTSGSFTGTNTIGNFRGGTYDSQFMNPAGDVNDFRPFRNLLATLVPTLAGCPYDILGNLRSAVDCAGAVSKNQATAPKWPMVT